MGFLFPTGKIGLNGTNYYAMGGLTVEFQPEINGSPSGIWANLGPINNPQPQMNNQVYDHFDARSGVRKKDMSVTTEQSLSIQFQTDEHNPMVMSAMLLGNAYEETGTTVAVVDEVVTIGANGWGLLAHTPKATPAPVVTNMAGTTTYAVNTDYQILVGPDGKSYVVINPGGAITVGQQLKVDYSYDSGTELVIMPLTVTEIPGQIRLTWRANKGKNWQWYHSKVSLKPSGNPTFNVAEVSTAEFTAEFLYVDTATYVVAGSAKSSPFGYLRYDITLP